MNFITNIRLYSDLFSAASDYGEYVLLKEFLVKFADYYDFTSSKRIEWVTYNSASGRKIDWIMNEFNIYKEMRSRFVLD